MKSYDFLIAGNPYIAAQAPGIQLGAALTEPAKPSEVGSIVISSLHGGVGRGVENQGIMKYKAARQIDCTIPGEVTPGYVPQSIADVGTNACDIMRPKIVFFPGIFSVAFIIAGTKVYSFDPANPGGGISDALDEAGTDFPDNAEYSGSAFIYNQSMVLGIIETTAGTPGKPIGYGLVTAADTDTVTLHDTPGISYGASSRARCFWVENAGGSDTGLRWAPMVAGATFKGGGSYTEQPTTGPGIELGFPRPSWLTMIGSSLLIMRTDGTIVGGNETGVLTVVGTVPQGTVDYGFGRGAVLYHDGVHIPGAQGVWAFDLRSLTLRPASPNYIQGQVGNDMRGPVTAVAASGPYLYLAQRQRSLDSVDLSSIGRVTVRYANLVSVHDLLPRTADDVVYTDFLAYHDTTLRVTRLYYLTYNEDSTVEHLSYVQVREPNDQIVDDTQLTSSAEFDMNQLAGPQPAANMTKLWLQVRGFYSAGSAVSPTLEFDGFQIDGQTALTIAPVTVPGPFVAKFEPNVSGGVPSDVIGRVLTAGTVKMKSAAHDTDLMLPLTIDFIWVPSHSDAVTFKALVSGEVQGKVASLWDKGAYGQLQPLLDLRGTVTTIQFPEGTTWNVLVEGVQIDSMEDPPEGAGQVTRVATIQVRRLT